MKSKLLLSQICITVCLVAFACLVLIEAPPRISRHFLKTNKSKPIQCKNISILGNIFLYGSCPNNTYVNQPGPDYPSMITTTSCTDSEGFRVNCQDGQRVFNRSDYHTYLIGDSFIQAEEIDYSQSVYGLINNSKTSHYRNAYGFGYSSWNTRQYLQAIKAINKKNSNYDIYLFANDITPRYGRSVYGEINSKVSDSNKSKNQFLLRSKRFLLRSVTMHKLAQIPNRIQFAVSEQDRIRYWAHYKTASLNQCPSVLDQKKIDSFSMLARDFIMYSYVSECWDDTQKESYDLVKEDLNQILFHGDSLNSKVRIILIPPGFSFLGENAPGRLHAKYDIPNDIRLSLFGLRKKLAEDFGDHLFDVENDLYKEIENFKKKCNGNCENAYYFGHDGHFTARGHEFLFRTLYSR